MKSIKLLLLVLGALLSTAVYGESILSGGFKKLYYSSTDGYLWEANWTYVQSNGPGTYNPYDEPGAFDSELDYTIQAANSRWGSNLQAFNTLNVTYGFYDCTADCLWVPVSTMLFDNPWPVGI
jgi:hypothetical protein